MFFNFLYYSRIIGSIIVFIAYKFIHPILLVFVFLHIIARRMFSEDDDYTVTTHN